MTCSRTRVPCGVGAHGPGQGGSRGGHPLPRGARPQPDRACEATGLEPAGGGQAGGSRAQPFHGHPAGAVTRSRHAGPRGCRPEDRGGGQGHQVRGGLRTEGLCLICARHALFGPPRWRRDGPGGPGCASAFTGAAQVTPAAIRAPGATLTVESRHEEQPAAPARAARYGGGLPHADRGSPEAVQIALYRALFAGRADVYAYRWENAATGEKGWAPRRVPGSRKEDGQFLPLTHEVIAGHLTDTPQAAGLYVLFPDSTCRLLACDFDGPAWRLDAVAYVQAACAAGVPAALEVSRSGEGAHVWIFFSEQVAAADARALGAALLREAMAIRGELAEPSGIA